MSDGRRIVIVDDDAEIRELLTAYLTQHGFEVEGVADSASLDRFIAASGMPDLLLLDLGLPGEDGYSVARRLRPVGATGPAIIMVTGAGTVVDRVVGLELGADDYIAKPFDLRELLARVRAVLRRAPNVQTVAGDEAEGIIPFGPWRLDLAARTLKRHDGAPVELTAMEFDLLAVFAGKPNRVLTRDQLLDMAHHRDNEPFDRSIDVRIARLRRKIEVDASRPQYIKTIRGAGYMFSPRGD